MSYVTLPQATSENMQTAVIQENEKDALKKLGQGEVGWERH